MRQANSADIDTVLEILLERTVWLQARGSDQWSNGRDFRDGLAARIAHGQTWLAEDDGVAIGTVTIRRGGNPTFWTPEELTDRALYASKSATVLDRSGGGLGAMILRWLLNRTAEREMQYLRWDAWRTNDELHAFYQRLGVTLVRKVEAEGKPSGALFQIAPKPLDLSAEWVTVLDEERQQMLAERAAAQAALGAAEAAVAGPEVLEPA
jgi:GNAT superfamily N-acetyltransferase